MQILTVLLASARLRSTIATVGLVALGVYHLSIGDLPGTVTALTAAFGLEAAANSGPTTPAKPA